MNLILKNRKIYEHIIKENGSIPKVPPFPVVQKLLAQYKVPFAAAFLLRYL